MQGIVIQGPTDYCKYIVPVYRNIENVVWSTWVDELPENIEYIKQHMPVILDTKPANPGYLNVNLQLVSTSNGIKYLKDKGVTEMLKIRGDILVNKLGLFLSLLKGKQMAYLAIGKKDARKDIYYELVYPHYSHDYPPDQVIYGSIENLEKAYGFISEGRDPIPPEALIAYFYLTAKGIEFKLEYDHFIENGIYFYLNDCVDNGIELKLIKDKYYNIDLVQGHNSKEIYEF